MAKNRNSTFKSVFGALLAIGLFAVIALVVYVFVISPLLEDDPATPESTDFSVAIGDTIYDKDSTIALYSEYTVFKVYSEEEFKVEIMPLSNVNFDYFVNGEAERYAEVEDLFDVFGVLYTDTGFSINPPQGDIIDVLAKYHNVDRSSILIDGDISKIEAFFVIKISTHDNSITLTCIFGSEVSDIYINNENVIFEKGTIQ